MWVTNLSRKYRIHPNHIRQVLFLLFLAFLGIVIAKELYFMFNAFLAAVTLYVILQYPMKYLVIIHSWKPWIAAVVLMLLSLIIMVLPLGYLISIAIERLTPIINQPELINSSFATVHNYLEKNFDIDVFNRENIEKITSQVIPFAQKTLGNTVKLLGTLTLLYLFLYFLLVDNRKVEIWVRRNLPFKIKNVKSFTARFRSLVYSNAVGIPFVAVVQGVVGIIGYLIFGVEEFILMGILTAISSVIPIVGTMIVYVPLGIYQIAINQFNNGIGVMLWGFLVIGSIDNVARFLLQKKLAEVHPLITLIGVILGLNLFGFIGIVFGPILLSTFFILASIYIDEFGKADANKPEVDN